MLIQLINFMSKLSKNLVIGLAITGGLALVLIGLAIYLWNANNLHIVGQDDYGKIDKYDAQVKQDLENYQKLESKAFEQIKK